MQNEWYDNVEDANNLQNRIANLQQSTEALVMGNKHLLNNITRHNHNHIMPIKTIDDVWDNVESIDRDLSQGHVSIQEASQAVEHINKAWDDFANDCDTRLGVNLSTLVQNQDVFDAFGGIKQGAVTGVGSVSSFFNAVDSFKGGWRDPEQARQKLETGLEQISNGVRQLGTTISNIAKREVPSVTCSVLANQE